MSESIKRKLATEEKTTVRRARLRSQEEATDIQTNTFYNIVLSDSIQLKDKVEQVAKALEFTNDKEKDRTNIKEFEEFKEYLQSISETMSKQRIEMTDTGTFSELQKVYGEFNDDLNEFIDKIVVSAPRYLDGKRYQLIDIHYKGVGIINIQTPEEFEKGFRAKMKQRRQKSA